MPTVPFNGTVRMEWFQAGETVAITYYVKDRLESDVTVRNTDTTLEVTICLNADGREYHQSLDPLFAPLKPGSKAVVSVRPMKVEVTLQKASAYQWPSLEGKSTDAVPVPAASTAPATGQSAPEKLSYPNSKGKDWSKVALEIEDEKPEGDAALNALFKQIYGDGTDEQRRAMIKSFTESGGTVLSTNWQDVGKRKVEPSPPTGMEKKTMMD